MRCPTHRSKSVQLTNYNKYVDDSFYRRYNKEFLPYIRTITPADKEEILAREKANNDRLSFSTSRVALECDNYHMLAKILRLTSISEEEVNRLRNLTLEPGWTWECIYKSINKAKKSMITTMTRFDSGYWDGDTDDSKPMSMQKAINNEGYCQFKDSRFDCNAPLFDMYYLEAFVNEHDFMPDEHASTTLNLQDLNAAINDAKYRHEKDPSMPELQRHLKNDGSPLHEFKCTREGICCWSFESQSFKLIFPMSALRFLFYDCDKQVRRETEAKLRFVRQFIDQEVTISFKHGGDEEVVKLFLEQHELKIESLTTDDGIVTAKCTRCPKWKHHPDACYHKGCAKKGESLNSDNEWDGFYCADHDSKHNEDEYNFNDRKRQYHRKEFLAYPLRPNLEIKDQIIDLKGIKFQILSVEQKLVTSFK